MNSVTALVRNEKGAKARKAGYIPGVLYGSEIEKSYVVKFKKSEMMKVIKENGDSAKLIVYLEEDKKYGVIKKVDRNPIKRDDIYNIDVQIVSKNEEIKQSVPIIFEGKANIESRDLSLQTHLSEVDVIAKAIEMPENFIIDVKGKNNGDLITVKDIETNGEFEIINEPETVIAAIFYGSKQEEVKEE